MFLSPSDVAKLKTQKLSVVQEHVILCVLVNRVAFVLTVVLAFLWRKTGSEYFAIFAVVTLMTFIGVAVHLNFGRMNTVRKALIEKAKEL